MKLAGADDAVEVHEVGIGERALNGHAAEARPAMGLLLPNLDTSNY